EQRFARRGADFDDAVPLGVPRFKAVVLSGRQVIVLDLDDGPVEAQIGTPLIHVLIDDVLHLLVAEDHAARAVIHHLEAVEFADQSDKSTFRQDLLFFLDRAFEREAVFHDDDVRVQAAPAEEEQSRREESGKEVETLPKEAAIAGTHRNRSLVAVLVPAPTAMD